MNIGRLDWIKRVTAGANIVILQILLACYVFVNCQFTLNQYSLRPLNCSGLCIASVSLNAYLSLRFCVLFCNNLFLD